MNTSRADNTQHVQFGDIIQTYFTGEGDPKVIGTFEVAGPKRHPNAGPITQAFQNTSTVQVDERAQMLLDPFDDDFEEVTTTAQPDLGDRIR